MSFTTLSTIKQGAFVLIATYLVSRIFRRFVLKNPLDVVRGPKAESFTSGVILKLFDPTSAWDYHAEITKKYPRVARIPAELGRISLYVYDPKALYSILLKDQNSFDQSDDFLRINNLMFGPGLLSTHGDRHRKQRRLMNPVFSAAHLRDMTSIFYNVGHALSGSIKQQIKGENVEIDFLTWMTRTGLELIAQSGFGTSFDSLEPDAVPHPYATSMKKVMDHLGQFTFSRFVLLPTFMKIGTPKFRRWVLDTLPWKKAHRFRDVIDTMHKYTNEIYHTKKRAMQNGEALTAHNIGNGKDIISILLKANLAVSEEERLPDEEILGQISTLAFAGMDTTSNALSRALTLLSEHPEAQARAREEILEYKRQNGDEDIPYDDLVQLPYLDALCRETLRVHPPLPMLMRQAKQDTVLPLSQPVTAVDGSEINEVFVPSGTQVLIPMMACNKDPLIWGEDAEEWKPERWLSPLPDTVVNSKIPGVYSHLMSFMGGSRACIGFKFAQLEMKVILALLLESFVFKPSEEKKIMWKFNAIVQPAFSQKGDSQPPSVGLPIVVSRYEA